MLRAQSLGAGGPGSSLASATYSMVLESDFASLSMFPPVCNGAADHAPPPEGASVHLPSQDNPRMQVGLCPFYSWGN